MAAAYPIPSLTLRRRAARAWDCLRHARRPRQKQALDATRQQLKSRTSTLVVAMVSTVLPLTFVFQATVTFFLIRDAPFIGITWWAAAIMWTWQVRIRRRLRVSGL